MGLTPCLAALAAAAMTATPQPCTFQLDAGPPRADATLVEPGRRFADGFGYEAGSRNLFSIAVPEGNWRVTMTLGDARRAGDTTIKAEQRRLMVDRLRTRPGQAATVSFVVNVRTPALGPVPANAPGGARVNPREVGGYSWDDRLTLELLGTPVVRTVAIEPAQAITLYLAGDSTVTDQRFEPAASWGQMLPLFLDDRVAVANHAESGETLKSFLAELRLDKILTRLKPGDFVFMQFGHNDQKAQWPQTYAEAGGTYNAYLRAYIAEVRRRGATPVLLTSPERRNFDDAGRIVPSLGAYPDAVRAVARSAVVPLIDLNAASIAMYQALGPGRSVLAFNDAGRDRTHHDNYGAWLLARAVAEMIRREVPALAAHIRANGRFDPASPPPPESISIVPSASLSETRPRGD